MAEFINCETCSGMGEIDGVACVDCGGGGSVENPEISPILCGFCCGSGVCGDGKICFPCRGTGLPREGRCMHCYGAGRIVVARRRWYVIGPIEPRLVQCPKCGGTGDRP